MTTRDPRSRAPSPSEAQGIGRDPTVSLDVPLDEDGDSPRDLALGTHEVGRNARTKLTEVASPAARVKTPPPARPNPPPIPRAASSSGEPDRVGTTLGSYRVLELLGKGGMGYVFRAEHTKLGREVALKLLRSDYARRRDAVARFFQEARTVNRVRHRNIVDVTDFVELEDGTTFIIMEFLRGDSLGKWARSGIDLPRALAVLVQICDGLAAAHDVGVIHRDLKPDNVIVVPTPDGAELVKLLDFGVAKLVNRDDEDIGFQTAAGSVIGTPAYMSPEQAGGMAVDGRSDIYSLGAIMYELFCGEPMFRGRSFGEYVRKHLTEMPVPPRQTPGGAQIDPRLDALIMRCLEKEPFHRFPNIAELRDALFAMLGGMETFLPGLASLTGSGVRGVASGVSVRLSPMPQLPSAVPMSGSHVSYGSHASHASQQAYFSQMVPPTGVSPSTPVWVWIGGVVLAIGLGVVGAVWYASRGGEITPAPAAGPAKPPVSQPAPIAEPITAPPTAQLVEIKLDSTPPGAVFAEGNPTRLCSTPCTHTIDPKDGGSPDQRTFIVRSDGYKESPIVVDLRGSQRDFAVTLEALPEEPASGPAADKGGRPAVKPGTRTVRGIKRPGKRPDEQPARPDDKKPARPDDKKPDPPETPDPSDATDGRPTKKPDRKPGPIDPTDTLDPFRPKQ